MLAIKESTTTIITFSSDEPGYQRLQEKLLENEKHLFFQPTSENRMNNNLNLDGLIFPFVFMMTAVFVVLLSRVTSEMLAFEDLGDNNKLSGLSL